MCHKRIPNMESFFITHYRRTIRCKILVYIPSTRICSLQNPEKQFRNPYFITPEIEIIKSEMAMRI